MSIRGRVAIVGVGETAYYKHGCAPESEFALALRAILSACEDAGIDPRQVDGFASYSNDRNDPSRLAAALGLPELRLSDIPWGGGSGGGAQRPPGRGVASGGFAGAARASGGGPGPRGGCRGRRGGRAPCAGRPPTSWAWPRARSIATRLAATTRPPMRARASPRWPRISGRWPASAPRT